MQQIQQRGVQTMKLYYNASKKYKKPIPEETGRNPKYNIKELRQHPETDGSAPGISERAQQGGTVRT